MNTNNTDIYNELISKDWTTNINDNENSLVQYDEPPTYETFIRECFLKNRPALFTAKCGLIKQWACITEWLNKDQTEPDFDRLINLYGHMTVPVTKCSSNITEYNTDENKLNMRFDEFVNLWRNNETTSEYYCKDWHLQKISDETKTLFYTVPNYFQSDWLNEKCLAENEDDFRFVYMGGNGTNTPVHMDVLGTYSWSANICGQKRWRFSKPYSIEFIQQPGDILFVPSEWYHDVTNIGYTISINHNWFNAFNIFRIWKHLCLTLNDIEHRIEDCRSIMTDTWYEHCQLILQANEGMNFSSLYKLLYIIVQRRIKQNNNEQTKFDLWMIDKLIRQMLHTAAFLYACDFDTFPQRPKAFLKQIHSFIEKQKQ
ncbi:unnamed protein product [Rotaria sp. Silwood1]|nr:unnamed protein product [Rotaria sp. Silwood1]CAF3423245.1 unnamed protein product [Rotaria sp. Silwood1]CAF3468186.1 unnamed protein product [Rotaria sp. Silwood1]CAF4843257.1 unnamed protein product [Rotaria sp. Silwood1]CAF4846160.1 unnamed protein product [Rotaria sp. Silwood1]